eukprot:8492304-Pyramimonas_sp.AAC.1
MSFDCAPSQHLSSHAVPSCVSSRIGNRCGNCKSELKFRPTPPLRIAGSVPFRFSSFCGPCRHPV